MSNSPSSDLRRRMIADMTVRSFSDKTQHDYIRHIETFAKFLGRAPDSATGDDIRRFHEQIAQGRAVAEDEHASVRAALLAQRHLRSRRPCPSDCPHALPQEAAACALARGSRAPTGGRAGPQTCCLTMLRCCRSSSAVACHYVRPAMRRSCILRCGCPDQHDHACEASSALTLRSPVAVSAVADIHPAIAVPSQAVVV
jgi:hypothetical protein